MKSLKTIVIVALSLVVVLAFSLPLKKKITVYLIGDSTMCEYEANRSPLTGWGMPFKYFFDNTVVIENKAKGGRSTKTFISENRWQPIEDHLQEGDYVLIQFGHNDESKGDAYKDRYTPIPEYKTNLIKFITATKAKKAIPVLITPVTRMYFDKEGNIKETHIGYSSAVFEVGKEYNVPVIDLDKKSRDLLQQLGVAKSKMLYMQLDSLQHPNYPGGKKDNTHFNDYGAQKIALLVIEEIKNLKLELAERIVSNQSKN